MVRYNPNIFVYTSITLVVLLLSIFYVSLSGTETIIQKFTWYNYAFIYTFLNIIFITGYYNLNRNEPNYASWFMIALFCIFACWSADYISLGESFLNMNIDTEYKDFLYPYLSVISFKSYNLFRFFIWGTATFLVFKLAKEYKVKTNVMAFVFPIIFLLLFSYARASLAMALYFTGLTYLLKRGVVKGFAPSIIFFIIAFAAHRSMLILIAITPLAFIKLTKQKLFIIIPLMIIASLSLNYFATSFLDSDTLQEESFQSFNKSGNSYLNNTNTISYNWKFGLITLLQNCSFIFINLYLIWKIIVKKVPVHDYIRKLLTLTTIITLLASAFLFNGFISNVNGLNVVGYRFLFMTGIPLSIILSYCYTYKICNTSTLFKVLSFSIIYSEFYIFGKLISI